jgi:tetratricopeptide (TPR) repeat protein
VQAAKAAAHGPDRGRDAKSSDRLRAAAGPRTQRRMREPGVGGLPVVPLAIGGLLFGVLVAVAYVQANKTKPTAPPPTATQAAPPPVASTPSGGGVAADDPVPDPRRGKETRTFPQWMAMAHEEVARAWKIAIGREDAAKDRLAESRRRFEAAGAPGSAVAVLADAERALGGAPPPGKLPPHFSTEGLPPSTDPATPPPPPPDDEEVVAKPVAGGPVASRPEPSKPAPSKPEPSKPEPSKPEPAKPSKPPRKPASDPGAVVPPSVSTALDADYLARRAQATDAAGLLKLARWAEGQELFEEQKDALVLAVRAEPESARVRKELDDVLAEERKHARFETPWRRDTPILFVETNTSQALLHFYCDSVVAFFKRFSKVFRVPQDPVQAWGRKIGVKIFANRNDFDRYRREKGSGGGESTIGFYSLVEKELVLYHDAEEPELTLNVLFHEGTHLFCDLALGDRVYNLPIWVREGIAEYFGTARFDREKKDIDYGKVNFWRLYEARPLVEGNNLSLKADLLAVNSKQSFNSQRYALAWALCHMLLEKKRPGTDKYIYRDRFLAYFEGVANRGDPIRTFEANFGQIPPIGEEWKAWIKDIPLSPFDEGRELLYQGDVEKAITLLEKHRADEPKDAKGAYWLARAYEEADRTEDAARLYEECTELDPNHELAHAGLALRSLELGRAAQAVTAAEGAVRIRASGSNQLLLAIAAIQAGEKAKALAALAEAKALLGASRGLLQLEDEAKALP